MKEHASNSQMGMDDIAARAERMCDGYMPQAREKARRLLIAYPEIKFLIEKTRDLPLQEAVVAA